MDFRINLLSFVPMCLEKKCSSLYNFYFKNLYLLVEHQHVSIILITYLFIRELFTTPLRKITLKISFLTIACHKVLTSGTKLNISSAFYPFLWIWGSIRYHFLLSWRTSFIISYRAGLPGVDFSQVFFSENVLISTLFLRIDFNRYRILDWYGFFRAL